MLGSDVSEDLWRADCVGHIKAPSTAYQLKKQIYALAMHGRLHHLIDARANAGIIKLI